jgi:hypothetical protein
MEMMKYQNHQMSLLYKPSIYYDECILSYLIRLSESNGFFDIGKLLKHAGLNWKNNRAPVHQILTGEFDLASILSKLQLPKASSRLAPIYSSFQRVIDTSYLITKYPKVCPECLQELGFCRYQWALLPVLACTKHRKVLLDINPSDGKRLSWYRHYIDRFDEESFIRSSELKASSSAMQQSLYIEALISGQRPIGSIPSVLIGLELKDALSLMHFIAHFQLRLMGEVFSPVALINCELAYIYENVWEALQNWPDSFYSLLSQYVDKPMSKRGQSGLNKHFRDLSERLHRQRENAGITRIKTEFDRYIEWYWPGVLNAERVTRIKLESSTRNIISKKQAAKILGSRPERIDKLVQQDRISLVIFKGKAHYLRDQIESLAHEISSNWTMAEACKALEVSRYQLKQLLEAGIIPTVQKPDDLNRDWIVDKGGSLSLINQLVNNGEKSVFSSECLSLKSLQCRGYSIVKIILSMQSGGLKYCIDINRSKSLSFRQFKIFKATKLK